MLEKLTKLLKSSYSPYSKVKVSSIVIASSGKEYKGVNIENASYGGTICAERSALANAVSNENGANSFKEIHIYSNVGKALFPCSICLQFMTEFFNKSTKIYIYGNENIITTNINKLVPFKVTKESF